MEQPESKRVSAFASHWVNAQHRLPEEDHRCLLPANYRRLHHLLPVVMVILLLLHHQVEFPTISTLMEQA